jgi:hypothetical protein
MWRALCAVVLLPSLTVAQSDVGVTAQAVQSQRSGPSAAVGPTKPVYRSYTYYNEVRQGTTESVAVQLAVPGVVTVARSAVPGIVPLRLELKPTEGFTIGKIRYPKTFKRKLPFQQEPIRVTDASWDPIQFKLHVDRSVALGAHTLAGRLTFQAINGAKGLGEVREVDVEIPVTVVSHDATVSRGHWPVYKMPVAAVVLLIVFLPILIPLVIPIYLICMAAGPRNCPD